jgi:methionyl-tRNA synthetase
MHKEENLPAVTSYKPLKAQVSYEDFDKLDFRVGKILKAEPVPNSKKLLKLEIDLGFEKRQVVSGIAHQIDISILVGKKVVLLANLKPAKLMGIESQGMIIVAGSEKIELLSVSNTDIGYVVS